MVINQEVFVDNHGRKKQQLIISTFFNKGLAKKGELLLLLLHPVNFNTKINPCGNHFWKLIFFGKLGRGILQSSIQNLVILCEENEVKFLGGKLKEFLLRDIRYMWHGAS